MITWLGFDEISVLPENEILKHFLQMAVQHFTFFSKKDSTCYDKWLRVAEWHGCSEFI